MRIQPLLFLFLLILAGSIQNSTAQSKFKEYFTDEEDGSVDLSGFLNSTTGFLPVPIIITEPAVGFGGGLTVAYFHKDKRERDVEKGEKGLSPIMSFAAGAYTTNDTWLVAGGHQGSYLDDRIRYLGVLGYVSANLTFYGAETDLIPGEYEFNMKGFLTFHEFLFRPVAKTKFFVGLNYTYFNNRVGFKTGIDIPELEVLEFNTDMAGMNAVFLWDSRNNTFTPYKGLMSTIEIGSFSKAFGGDTDYGNFSFRSFYYKPIIPELLFSGYKLRVAHKWGDVPFYELPFIDMRGIRALRYQGSNVYSLETEWRWNLFRRWSLVGFVGMGEALEDYNQAFKNIKVAGGAGFRYFLAKEYGLHAGLDVARGPEEWTWHITVGSNWLR